MLKKILLVITGGVACYKSLELIRLLRKRDVEVDVIMTEGAQQFITPLAVSSLTGQPTYHELFSLDSHLKMGHISRSRDVDLILVAPATAHFIGKLANGLADDLASTTLLASDKPLIVAPSMNTKMWLHPAFQRNLNQLKQDGAHVISPDDGELACGEIGMGRMAEPDIMVEYLLNFNQTAKTSPLPLSGKRALVTLGATIEAIDPVRFLSNRSSGLQGVAIAQSLLDAGAEVMIVAGAHTAKLPERAQCIRCESTDEMLALCLQQLPVDLAIFTAAVSDFKMASVASQKIKKVQAGQGLTLTLEKNPEIVTTIAHHKHRPKLIIGFAAETEHVIELAKEKRRRKGCDFIVANDVSEGQVFGQNENTVHWIGEKKHESWPRQSKALVAAQITQKINDWFGQNE